jgi:hypothetical protein
MSATNAASTAALLTGGYAHQDGIPADRFFAPLEGGAAGTWYQLGANGTSGAIAEPSDAHGSLAASNGTLIEQMDTDTSGSTVVVTGDTRECTIARGTGGNDCSSGGDYRPTSSDGFPCDPPYGPQSSGNTPSPTPSYCTSDLNTMNKAATAIGSSVRFAYVYLPEVGLVKQHTGEVDTTTPPQPVAASLPPNTATPSLAQQLKDTDAAIAAFATQYDSTSHQNWQSTYMFVVGNHGYELTPPSHRVLAPGTQQDLAEYVHNTWDHYTFVPQGTLGLVYAPKGATGSDRQTTLKAIKDHLLGLNQNQQCTPPAGPCIDEVLYTNAADADAVGDSTYAGADGKTHSTVVDVEHPTWQFVNHKLLPIDPAGGAVTGLSGDLVVVFHQGWAAERATPVDATNATTATTAPTDGNLNPYEDPINPWPASAGGPRNRAIAAILSGGPSLTSNPVLEYRYDPTQNDGRDPVLDDSGNSAYTMSQSNPTPAVDQANVNPGDDAFFPNQTSANPCGDPTGALNTGHFDQPNTVDFAPTIASLLQVSVPPGQLAGCFLHGGDELHPAFKNRLQPFNDSEPLGGCPEDPSACPPPEPPQPPSQISIAPTPPPYPEWGCGPGLYQNLRAQVVDSKYKPVGQAKPGSPMSFMQISADFCRPKSAVTLTLYVKPKPKAKAGRASRRSSTERLLAQVHFCPFTVPKGPNVKLRFKVPDRYQPTHVGLLIQEVNELPPGERHPVTKVGKPSHGTPACPPPNFRPVGHRTGAIVAIRDASYLHRRAPAHVKKGRRGPGKHKRHKSGHGAARRRPA